MSYSLAIGVKMNILLFAPGLLLLLLQADGVLGTAVCLSICAGVQVRWAVQHSCPGFFYRACRRWGSRTVVRPVTIFAGVKSYGATSVPTYEVSFEDQATCLPAPALVAPLINSRSSLHDGLQLLLGAPFLLHHPVAYVSRSFELGRVFKFEWTVNFKFLNEATFVSPVLSVVLLALTVLTLSLFASKWVRSAREVKAFSADCGVRGRADVSSGGGSALVGTGGVNVRLHPEYIVKTLFVSNLIGIVFCRSLHYQVKKCAVQLCAGFSRPPTKASNASREVLAIIATPLSNATHPTRTGLYTWCSAYLSRACEYYRRNDSYIHIQCVSRRRAVRSRSRARSSTLGTSTRSLFSCGKRISRSPSAWRCCVVWSSGSTSFQLPLFLLRCFR